MKWMLLPTIALVAVLFGKWQQSVDAGLFAGSVCAFIVGCMRVWFMFQREETQ